MMSKTNSELMTFMRTQLSTIRNTKEASHTEAGGFSGASTHPSAKEDDQSQTASEGARSAENTSDIKEEVHQNTGVDGVEGTAEGGDDDNQYNIGNQAAATGEDPASEDPDKINAKDDADVNNQPTSHPAKGNTKQSEQIKEASALGDKLLADIVILTKTAEADGKDEKTDPKTAASKDDKGAAAEGEAKKAEAGMSHGGHGQSADTKDADSKPQGDNKHAFEEDTSAASKSDAAATDTKDKPLSDEPKSAAAEGKEGAEDFEAGREAAKVAAAAVEGVEKTAADTVANIEKTAADDANILCDFLAGFTDGQTKAAMDGGEEDMTTEEGEGEDHKEEDTDKERPSDKGGEGTMDAEGAMGDMMDAAPEAPAAPPAMGGGGGYPGMEGGMPPGPGMEGGMPPGAEGGMPPGAEGGMPPMPGGEGGGLPGGMSEEELMALLQQAVAAESMGPEAMQVAASFVDEARVRDQKQQVKAAYQQKLVTLFRSRLQGIKAAAAKAQPAAAPEAKPEPAVAAAS